MFSTGRRPLDGCVAGRRSKGALQGPEGTGVDRWAGVREADVHGRSEDMMLSFSRFVRCSLALQWEVCSDKARLVWNYALTVSRTHSSMRLSSSDSTSWLANSSESCWARPR